MMMSKSLTMTSPICIIFTAITMFVALVSVTLGGSGQSDVALHIRQKRDVFQLCEIMETYTNRDCFDYLGYGCFCGLGRTGNNPVDDVDRCCSEHDRCYDKTGCQLWEIVETYNYECSGGSCNCTDSPKNSCELNTCQCDLRFAQCIGRTNYSSEYSDYNKALCK